MVGVRGEAAAAGGSEAGAGEDEADGGDDGADRAGWFGCGRRRSSCARLGPFDCAHGRLAGAPVPTRTIPTRAIRAGFRCWAAFGATAEAAPDHHRATRAGSAGSRAWVFRKRLLGEFGVLCG